MTKNTVIGTIIAIKNPPQNSSPHRRIGKNQPRVYPIDGGCASASVAREKSAGQVSKTRFIQAL